MTTVTKTVTNQDLLGVMHDLMQMTSEGFQRLEGRMDRLEGRMDKVELELRSIWSKLHEHDLQLVELLEITGSFPIATPPISMTSKTFWTG